MRAACYVGERTLKVVEQEPRAPADGRGGDRRRLHGHLRHRPAHPARRDGRSASRCRPCSATRCRARSPRSATASSGWSVGERVTVMPLGSVRPLPGVPRGQLAHLPQPQLPRHRLAGLDAVAAGTCRRTVLVGLPASALARARARSPSRPLSRFTTCAGRSLREGERALVVGGGPIGLLVACAARARGADVVVVELSERRRELRAGGRAAGASTLRADDVQAFVVGLDRRRGRRRRVRGLRRGRRHRDGASSRSPCADGWSSSRSTRPRRP